MLAAALKNQHIEIKQREDDADVVTVQTALKKSQKGYPAVVTQDVDILVLSSCLARQAFSSNEATD